MPIKVEVKNLYKIFGEHPEKAFKLIEAGKTKEQIFEKTGLSVGIKNATLSIKEGEIFVIMGLSGSGKSTMVRLFNQLIKPTRGQVMIDGEDITQVTDKRLRAIRRQKMSMVFQSFALMPHLNVIDNAAFGLELSGETRDIRREKALEALKQVGLENYANSYPDELSGGMCQRVGLARALANNPDILLMDEAFSALDPLIRAEMQDELIQLQAQQQRTIIFISHDLDEAMRIGDRIAIMQDGEVIQVGTPDEILNNPANDYVKTFFKGVDLGQVFSAKDIVRRHSISVIRNMPGMGPRSVIRLLQDKDHDFGYVIEKNYRFTGVVSIDSLKKSLAENLTVEDSLIEHPQAISGETQLNEIINQVATAPCALPVIDDKQKFLGVISKGRLLRALDRETSINE